jgi:hypothetical protein
MNEELEVSYKNFTQIKTGKGEWSDRLMIGLNEIKEDYVFYLQEDYWPYRQIPTDMFKNMYKQFRKLNMHQVKIGNMINTSSKKRWRMWFNDILYEDGIAFRKLARSSGGAMSHRPAIWKKNFLLSRLKPNEGPSENEERGVIELRRQMRRKNNLRIYGIQYPWMNAVIKKGIYSEYAIDPLCEMGKYDPNYGFTLA